jgi:hypothetical protein
MPYRVPRLKRKGEGGRREDGEDYCSALLVASATPGCPHLFVKEILPHLFVCVAGHGFIYGVL